MRGESSVAEYIVTEMVNLVFDRLPGPGARDETVINKIIERWGSDDPVSPSAAAQIAIDVMKEEDRMARFIESEDLMGQGIGVGDWIRLRGDKVALQVKVDADTIRRSREREGRIGG
jgi:hypothetical protein